MKTGNATHNQPTPHNNFRPKVLHVGLEYNLGLELTIHLVDGP